MFPLAAAMRAWARRMRSSMPPRALSAAVSAGLAPCIRFLRRRRGRLRALVRALARLHLLPPRFEARGVAGLLFGGAVGARAPLLPRQDREGLGGRLLLTHVRGVLVDLEHDGDR